MNTFRILAVCIETYSDSAWDLTGLSNDCDRMRALFRDFYSLSEYRELRNKEATKVNIQTELVNLLMATKEGEIAIFYYTGHGVRLPIKYTSDPNELDLKDDALFPYECTTESLIVDNWIGATISLNLNPKACLIFITDACHSGSILKAMDPFIYVKAKEVPFDKIIQNLSVDALRNNSVLLARAQQPFDNLPIIQLSAAQENEVAISTELPGGVKGSIFTYALTEVVRGAAKEATWATLKDPITQMVRKLTNVHNPEIIFYGGTGERLVIPPSAL